MDRPEFINEFFDKNSKTKFVFIQKKDFLQTSYNETKSKFLKEMNIDPEYDNFVEFQDISTDTERYIFDYLFSAKCFNLNQVFRKFKKFNLPHF